MRRKGKCHGNPTRARFLSLHVRAVTAGAPSEPATGVHCWYCTIAALACASVRRGAWVAAGRRGGADVVALTVLLLVLDTVVDR